MFDHHVPHPHCCGVSTDLQDYFLTRRQFLNRVGMGLGALSLATFLDPLDLIAGHRQLPARCRRQWWSVYLLGIDQGTSVNIQARQVQQMIQNIGGNYVSRAEQRRQACGRRCTVIPRNHGSTKTN